MIPQLLIKLIIPKVADHMMRIFKLDKLLQYMEEPNELDVQMRDVEQKCTDIGFKVKAMQTVLKDLDDKSHPPAIDIKEFENMKDTIKKIKNKKVFKSLNVK